MSETAANLPPLRERARHQAGLWFGLVGGIAAWAAHLNLSYLIVPHTCVSGQTIWLHLITIAMLVVAGMASRAGWRVLRVAEREPGTARADQRGRFLGTVGALLSGLFVAVIAVQGAQVLFVDPCL